MTDLKDFLTGSAPTDVEREAYGRKLEQVNQALIDALPQLRDLFGNIKDGKDGVQLETRRINIAIPKAYWDSFDRVIEVYQLRDEFDIRDPEDEADQVQDNVAKVYREEAPSLSIAEVLMSQFMLDTVMGFAIHVARAQMMEKVQVALESGDPEALLRLLKNITNAETVEGLNEPDDEDDDSET
jgi:hypothetical protein